MIPLPCRNTSMSIFMHRYLLTIFFLCLLGNGIGAFEDPKKFRDIDPKYIDLNIIDPKQKVGFTVGDTITRQISITIKKPFFLVEESLPIVGYEKRYRGQLLGMSLVESNHTKKATKEGITYDISLTYQIFTNNVVAKPAFITADYYRVVNPAEPDNVFKYRIPALTVAVSPIAVFGDIKVEDDMSGYRGPFFIDSTVFVQKMRYAITALVLSLVVLLYIYSKYSWVPKLNKWFSHTYRKFKKIPASKANIELFIKALHTSFDKTINQTLFMDNKNFLYQQNPSFRKIDSEIDEFFALSRDIFFEQKKAHDLSKTYAWLKLFSLHCRMCERKLIVDTSDLKKLSS